MTCRIMPRQSIILNDSLTSPERKLGTGRTERKTKEPAESAITHRGICQRLYLWQVPRFLFFKDI